MVISCLSYTCSLQTSLGNKFQSLLCNMASFPNETLSMTEFNRLFILWFNTRSPDNASISKSDFCDILSQIFSSSLNETQISEIFTRFTSKSDDDGKEEERVFLKDVLSENDDGLMFANTMKALLLQDGSAEMKLRSAPKECLNTNGNDNVNALMHGMLYEAVRESECLKARLSDIYSMDSKQKVMEQELKLLSEENERLQTERDSVTKLNAELKGNYDHSVQQNRDLILMNDDYKSMLEQKNNEIQQIHEAMKILKARQNASKLTATNGDEQEHHQAPRWNDQRTIRCDSNTMDLALCANGQSSYKPEFYSASTNKSYIFQMRATSPPPPPTKEDCAVPGFGTFKSHRSVLRVGGGQPSTMKMTAMNKEEEVNHGKYTKLFSDEQKGLDVYVFTDYSDEETAKTGPANKDDEDEQISTTKLKERGAGETVKSNGWIRRRGSACSKWTNCPNAFQYCSGASCIVYQKK